MQATRAMYPVPQQLTAVLPHRRERQLSKISRIPIGILSENAFVEQLLKLLDDGMPLLNDRGFDAEDLLGKAPLPALNCWFVFKGRRPRPDKHAFPTASTSPGSTGSSFASSMLTSA